MKTVNIEIKGVSPLLINRFKEADEVKQASRKLGSGDKYGTPREQAELTPYFDQKTKRLWVPSSWIMGSIATIASDFKIPGSRKSVKSVSGGAIVPQEEKIYFNEKYCVKDIEVDSRPVVIQRARIMRHRARLENWTLNFDLEIDDEIIDTELLNELMVNAGKRAGLGDYRPPKGGPFGRYLISSWKVLGEKPVKTIRKAAKKKVKKVTKKKK